MVNDEQKSNMVDEERGEREKSLTKTQASFFNNIVTGNAIEDIGETPAEETKEGDRPLQLESHEQRVLNDIHRILGSEQVNTRKMECAPPCIVQKVLNEIMLLQHYEALIRCLPLD